MIHSIVKFLFGVTGELGVIDRAAFWTAALAIIAYFELKKANATSRADFNHRFIESFFKDNGRSLRMLFKFKLLKFKTKKINNEVFGYFELDTEQLEKSAIDDNDKIKLKQIYLDEEIDDELLGDFEDIGNYEKKGLLDFELINTGFGYYIKQIWENREIKEYVKWLRDEYAEGNATYICFEYIYNKVISYNEAEKNKVPICLWKRLWKMQWRWRTLKEFIWFHTKKQFK